jgi:3-methyladenine DNA glycosylase/8-oxoguanine DNA glycosylase
MTPHGCRVFAASGIDLSATLRASTTGRPDPTVCSRDSAVARAVLTPDGGGTLAVQWRADGMVEAEAWGAGATWLLDHAPGWCGLLDDLTGFAPPPGPVRELARRRPGLRLARTGVVWQELVPAVLGQRVTGLEAARSWARVVRHLGEPAPGPLGRAGGATGPTGLCLPPTPEALASLALHDWHRLDVERKRAETIGRAARLAGRLEEAVGLSPDAAAARLQTVPGIGAWTANTVVAVSHGSPDLLPIGDYNLPSLVAFALAGERRGTDERMLELLTPYAGHRWRACRYLHGSGLRPPRRAPRARLRPIRWH